MPNFIVIVVAGGLSFLPLLELVIWVVLIWGLSNLEQKLPCAGLYSYCYLSFLSLLESVIREILIWGLPILEQKLPFRI